MGKFFDKIAYDVPLYLLSDAPDARIAGEVHSSRKESEKYHEKSLELQKRTLEQLVQAHNGQLKVNPNEFQRGQAISLLRDLSNGIQRIYQSGEGTPEVIGKLQRSNEQGFATLHGDLSKIKGPSYAQFVLEKGQIDPEQFLVILSAYVKGILSETAQQEVETYIDREYSWRDHQNEVEAELKIIERKTDREIPVSKILTLMSMPSGFVNRYLRENSLQDFRVIIKLAYEFNCPVLKEYVRDIMTLQRYYTAALNTPVSPEVRVQLANQDALDGATQHQAMEGNMEARRNASITAMNYTLMDIARANLEAVTEQRKQTKLSTYGILQGERSIALNERMIQQNQLMIQQNQRMVQQGDDTNVNLGTIIDHLVAQSDLLAEGNDLLAEGNDHLIDLVHLVENFGLTLEEGFRFIGKHLAAIDMNIVMTRTSVAIGLQDFAEQIDYFGNLVQGALNRGNILLEEIVRLEQKGHENEAQQYYKDGKKCLDTAETEEDLIDAYAAFKMGAEKVKSSVENQYAAAYVAELLGHFKEAKERYGKVARRSSDQQKVLAKQAYRNIADINFRESNLYDAIVHTRKALELCESEDDILYDLARYLALYGEADEAFEIVQVLLGKNFSILEKLLKDPAFMGLKRKIKRKVWSKKVNPTSQELYDYFLYECGAIDDLAVELFYQLCLLDPSLILNNKFWLDPDFRRKENKIISKIDEFIQDKVEKLSLDQLENIQKIFKKLGVNSNSLSEALINAKKEKIDAERSQRKSQDEQMGRGDKNPLVQKKRQKKHKEKVVNHCDNVETLLNRAVSHDMSAFVHAGRLQGLPEKTAESLKAYFQTTLALIESKRAQPEIQSAIQKLQNALKNALPLSNLEKGNSGIEVRKLQQLLIYIGYLEIPKPTSHFGDKTRRSVARFQFDTQIIRDNQHKSAGMVGPKTRKMFKSAAATTASILRQGLELVSRVPERDIAPGEEGEDVKCLQESLMTLGYLRIKKPTSNYGALTKNAIVNFQLDHKIIPSVDHPSAGFFGKKTAYKLRIELAKKNNSSTKRVTRK